MAILYTLGIKVFEETPSSDSSVEEDWSFLAWKYSACELLADRLGADSKAGNVLCIPQHTEIKCHFLRNKLEILMLIFPVLRKSKRCAPHRCSRLERERELARPLEA